MYLLFFSSSDRCPLFQPAHLMQNVNIADVLKSGRIKIPWEPSVLHGFLDLEDLGAVASSILCSPEKHVRARYELVGRRREVFTEFVKTRDGNVVESLETGKDQFFEKLEWAIRGSLDSWTRNTLHRMFAYYDIRYVGLPGSTNALRNLLGWEPTTWQAMLERETVKGSQAPESRLSTTGFTII
ncbi:hypothetical protein EVG20_g2283 [Dentipellis fragilis]|uniref:Uncharacterized protein n=1 Tax=Dentipellis fragilis TaxID=205917 RepID=A0A4Y9Z7L4_9AGAM|nr:hypothetical protein EVG20_g2283 [Dentipellis fragilis]